MAVIDFPDTPVDGQIHIHPQTGTKYVWNTAKGAWIVNGSGGDVQGGLPIGSIVPYSSLTLPPGFFECAGQSLERAAYPSLFNVLGETWGPGNIPGTTFALPDFRGEFLRGWDHGKGTDSGRGFATHQDDEVKAHDHDMTFEAFSEASTGTNNVDGFLTGNVDTSLGQHTNSIAIQNNGSSVETRPKNYAVPYIIKAYDVVLNPGMVDVSVLAQFIANSQSQADFLDNQNGFLQLPDWLGGFLIQWGKALNVAAANKQAVTLPKAWSVGAHLILANRSQALAGPTAYACWGMPKDLDEIEVYNGTSGIMDVQWFAVGK